jgi:hypothetical protein
MAITPHFLVAVFGVAAMSERFGIIRGTSNHVDSLTSYKVEPPRPITNYNDVIGFSAERFDKLGFSFAEDPVLSGDAVLIKRSVIDKIGVFDFSYFGYFGDIDFGMRSHLAGFKLVCAKGAWLFHHGGGYVKTEAIRSGKSLDEAMEERLKIVNAAYQVFRAKWDPSLPPNFSEATIDDYGAFSERAPLRPALKCELPSKILNDLLII